MWKVIKELVMASVSLLLSSSIDLESVHRRSKYPTKLPTRTSCRLDSTTL